MNIPRNRLGHVVRPHCAVAARCGDATTEIIDFLHSADNAPVRVVTDHPFSED